MHCIGQRATDYGFAGRVEGEVLHGDRVGGDRTGGDRAGPGAARQLGAVADAAGDPDRIEPVIMSSPAWAASRACTRVASNRLARALGDDRRDQQRTEHQADQRDHHQDGHRSAVVAHDRRAAVRRRPVPRVARLCPDVSSWPSLLLADPRHRRRRGTVQRGEGQGGPGGDLAGSGAGRRGQVHRQLLGRRVGGAAAPGRRAASSRRPRRRRWRCRTRSAATRSAVETTEPVTVQVRLCSCAVALSTRSWVHSSARPRASAVRRTSCRWSPTPPGW